MDEILVHVSAPTTHKSDDMYRSLARAYADFEPYHSGESRGHDATTVKSTLSKSAPRRSCDDAHVTDLAGSKESYGSFPSCISSGDGVSIPPFAAASLESFDDSVVDSSRLAQLERIQHHWRKTTRPGSSFPATSSANVSSLDKLDATFIDDSQLAAQALQSQLFDRGSTTSADTSDGEEDGELERKSCSEPALPLERSPGIKRTATDQGVNIEAGSPRFLSRQGHPTTRINEPCPNPIHGRALSQNPLAALSQPLQATPLQERLRTTHPPSLDFSQLPIEVFPPAPEVSIRCPNTLPSQMTAYLDGLKQENLGRFKPAGRSRILRADERGYWLIDTVNWSQKEQRDFWQALCEHVRLGDFGWGVSVFREPPSSSKIEMGSNARLGQVRFYCWAEVVEETWLALWTCSRGNMAGSGTTLLDAEDTIVVQVP
ncbi:hypothetical protein K491DRAFT_13861 [Lophiostoma macrostomum CBS 122681]|uniref:Uncharacterized protein n=1 Tax=Lophiostoma macrostomum CBS 122681 TaxID=1314788 RepID=A0A6A6TVQ2_9PLEO|nr:hypothetical protein K491DRAFT_13861 [Lophiostoma macrostomum CBS 122681]